MLVHMHYGPSISPGRARTRCALAWFVRTKKKGKEESRAACVWEAAAGETRRRTSRQVLQEIEVSQAAVEHIHAYMHISRQSGSALRHSSTHMWTYLLAMLLQAQSSQK
jgi:hypothetical protein